MEAVAAREIVTRPASEDAPISTQDPMIIRWGLNVSVRDKAVEGIRCGFGVLPYGKWFPITKYPTPEEFHTIDEYQPKENIVMKTALDAQRYLEEMLAAKDAHGFESNQYPDWGFRVGFYDERDGAKMQAITETLLPTVSQMREFSEALEMKSPVSKCAGQDAFEPKGDREQCPSCWQKWILSDVCTKQIERAVNSGVNVPVRDSATQEITMVNVRPSAAEFAEARAITTTAIGTGISALSEVWANVVSELERGDRKIITDYVHGIRKDLHEAKPQDKTVALMRDMASANAPANNDALLASMAETQKMTLQLLAQMAGNKVEAATTPPTETQPTLTEDELSPVAQKMNNQKKGK